MLRDRKVFGVTHSEEKKNMRSAEANGTVLRKGLDAFHSCAMWVENPGKQPTTPTDVGGLHKQKAAIYIRTQAGKNAPHTTYGFLPQSEKNLALFDGEIGGGKDSRYGRNCGSAFRTLDNCPFPSFSFLFCKQNKEIMGDLRSSPWDT